MGKGGRAHLVKVGDGIEDSLLRLSTIPCLSCPRLSSCDPEGATRCPKLNEFLSRDP